MNLSTKHRLRDIENTLVVYQVREGWGRNEVEGGG